MVMDNELQQQLDYLTSQIQLYKETDPIDGNQFVEILQQVTSTLYFLEGERAIFHDKYQTIINQMVLSGSSVNKAENEAAVKVPEMYKLRHVLTSAYECVNAMRSQISWIKQERNSI